MAHRVGAIEEQMKTFAPVSTTVAVHTHQMDEGRARMDSIEGRLHELDASLGDLLTCVNQIKVKMEGMSARLALIGGIGAIIGGALATAFIAQV